MTGTIVLKVKSHLEIKKHLSNQPDLYRSLSFAVAEGHINLNVVKNISFDYH